MSGAVLPVARRRGQCLRFSRRVVACGEAITLAASVTFGKNPLGQHLGQQPRGSGRPGRAGRYFPMPGRAEASPAPQLRAMQAKKGRPIMVPLVAVHVRSLHRSVGVSVGGGLLGGWRGASIVKRQWTYGCGGSEQCVYEHTDEAVTVFVPRAPGPSRICDGADDCGGDCETVPVHVQAPPTRHYTDKRIKFSLPFPLPWSRLLRLSW